MFCAFFGGCEGDSWRVTTSYTFLISQQMTAYQYLYTAFYRNKLGLPKCTQYYCLCHRCLWSESWSEVYMISISSFAYILKYFLKIGHDPLFYSLLECPYRVQEISQIMTTLGVTIQGAQAILDPPSALNKMIICFWAVTTLAIWILRERESERGNK
jgi:hypothetical protein